MVMNLEEKLFNYLSLFWLRPENGLLTTFKSRVFEDLELAQPSIDISCADGLFMFLHLGGEFEFEFDIFRSTKASQFRHDKFVDIFDHYDSSYQVPVKKRPSCKISVGTDWKQDLLKKAQPLDLYDKLVLHDNNQLPLPFEDDSFQTAYSNSLYWVKNVQPLLGEVRRILVPGGRAILEMKTPSLLKTLDELEKYLSPEAVALLNRQRRETMPGSFEVARWKEMIKELGFRIEDIRPVYPSKVLIDIWNVGLRPVAHLLVQMTDSLPGEQRSRIKKEWVDIFYTLAKPLLNIAPDYSLEDAPYVCFVLKK